MSFNLCIMSYNFCLFYVLRLICNVFCLMSYILYLMSYVLCLMSYVLCLVSYILCLMYYASCLTKVKLSCIQDTEDTRFIQPWLYCTVLALEGTVLYCSFPGGSCTLLYCTVLALEGPVLYCTFPGGSCSGSGGPHPPEHLPTQVLQSVREKVPASFPSSSSINPLQRWISTRLHVRP